MVKCRALLDTPQEPRRAHRFQHHPAIRRQTAVRKCVRQVRRRQPLWPDRRQRLRQVHLHEDSRRRTGADRRQRLARSRRAHGLAAPGPVRLRGAARARRGAAGPRRHVEGDAGKGRHLHEPGGDRGRLPARRRAGSPVRRDGRLRRRGAGGSIIAGRRHPHRTARRPDEPDRTRLQAARAADAGAVLQPRHPAARRTDQQPRHQHHPLAGKRAEREQRHHHRHLARPPLSEPGLYPHGRPRFRHHQGLPRQLRRLHAGLDPGQGTPGLGQRQGQGQGRRTAGIRAPLLGQQVEGAPGHQPHEDDRQDQDRGLQAQLAAEPLHPFRAGEGTASPRARSRKRSSSATTARRCSATSASRWKPAKKWPSSAATASANRP